MTAERYALIARIPPEGLDLFQRYEDGVLPLLAEHGGALERRLRNADGTVEIHLLSFASAEALERYRADPRRQALAPLLERSGATLELIAVSEV